MPWFRRKSNLKAFREFKPLRKHLWRHIKEGFSIQGNLFVAVESSLAVFPHKRQPFLDISVFTIICRFKHERKKRKKQKPVNRCLPAPKHDGFIILSFAEKFFSSHKILISVSVIDFQQQINFLRWWKFNEKKISFRW